jgi:tRNA A-37 threonylcarbamoyl transferase component Bud32
MAELVVRSQCKSNLRQSLENALNLTFPLWGVISPLIIVSTVLQFIGYAQMHQVERANELIGLSLLLLIITVLAIVLKRLIASDLMVVDKDGIKLPHLIGSGVNVKHFISWNSVEQIRAVISTEDVQKSKIRINRKKGRPLNIDVSKLQPEFVEQFLLAASMWAPSGADGNLEELQSALREDARSTAQLSYTDLWDDELGRRFCPTAYIPLEPGRVIRNNTIKVVNHLASGGLSALYLCQLNGNQLVVLKEAIIPQQGAENLKEKAREMFEREAMLLMKLDNPGIVHVLDWFSEGERNYLLLEYINGIDLRQMVRHQGPQKEADILEWAIQVATSLKYLHEREQPIIHRDLTPDNLVLRNDGRVMLVDFGAANEFIGTATGTFVGKHSFIAPEQFRGKATTQSDIYAFGCTLFFLLVGEEPEALSQSNPKEKMPSVSDDLSELVQSCTQLEASDRYQTVAQLLPVLRRLAAQSAVI